MLNRNKKVVPLEEGFAELGLDAGKMLGSMERNSKLVEERITGTSGSGGPPIQSYGEPAHVADKTLLDSDGAPVPTKPDGSPMTEAELEEFKLLKKKVGTLARRKKKKAKLFYKKFKGKLKAKAKKYRKTAGAKKAKKRHARVLKRIGGPKKGKRVVTHTDLPNDLASLREDLNTSTGDGFVDDNESMTSFEEAALNASYLCILMCEVFDVMGETETAENLLQISESGASLSDDLTGVTSEEEMNAEQAQAFEELVSTTVKALRFWEGLGAPGLDEAIETRMAQDALGG